MTKEEVGLEWRLEKTERMLYTEKIRFLLSNSNLLEYVCLCVFSLNSKVLKGSLPLFCYTVIAFLASNCSVKANTKAEPSYAASSKASTTSTTSAAALASKHV